jgi:long-chain acyl-CoA synthetase
MVDGVAGEYVWQSYNAIGERIVNLGSYIAANAEVNDTIGLFAINRPEWVIGEHACYAYSMVTVPLYDTLGAEAIEYIITQVCILVF